MTFAEKIKSLRKGKGLTQAELSAATHISLAVIAGVESGRRPPSKEMAKRLAEYFGVQVETFLFEDAPITENAPKLADTKTVLLIADIVAEYLSKHGYKITPEQRATLIEHFYRMSITEPEKINEMLTLMGDMFLSKR